MNDAPPTTHGTAPGGLEPHRGTLILVLGILSLVLCGFFTGIPAWIMGKGDLAKIKDGMMDPDGEGMTKAGMICGMICCILTLVCGGLYLLMMILGVGLAAGSGNF
jgi:ABC-type Fe3+ transport system permease subunit